MRQAAELWRQHAPAELADLLDASSGSDDTIRRVAIHEAGHAVAGILLRRRFQYVTIEPQDGSEGHCAFPSDWHRIERMSEGGANSRDDYRLRLAVLTGLAGSAAEERAFGTHQLLEESDSEYVLDIAGLLCGGPGQMERYLDEAWNTVRRLFDEPRHWRAVQAIATALQDRHRLSYRVARRIWAAAEEQPR